MLMILFICRIFSLEKIFVNSYPGNQLILMMSMLNGK